jgi:hypothetical protein
MPMAIATAEKYPKTILKSFHALTDFQSNREII